MKLEEIANRIYLIRGQKVMLDSDLAELYDVPTSRLNEQVKRNLNRFPEDFMFQLTQEYQNLRSQFATPSDDSSHGDSSANNHGKGGGKGKGKKRK